MFCDVVVGDVGFVVVVDYVVVLPIICIIADGVAVVWGVVCVVDDGEYAIVVSDVLG